MTALRARQITYTIPDESFPDMRCGASMDGTITEMGLNEFRPEYISVEVDDHGILTELRLWGPMVTIHGVQSRQLDWLFKFARPQARACDHCGGVITGVTYEFSGELVCSACAADLVAR